MEENHSKVLNQESYLENKSMDLNSPYIGSIEQDRFIKEFIDIYSDLLDRLVNNKYTNDIQKENLRKEHNKYFNAIFNPEKSIIDKTVKAEIAYKMKNLILPMKDRNSSGMQNNQSLTRRIPGIASDTYKQSDNNIFGFAFATGIVLLTTLLGIILVIIAKFI